METEAENPKIAATGLQQYYTNIVRSALLEIGDKACVAQCALCPDELAQLGLVDRLQLLLDAHRALNNTRIAEEAVRKAIKLLSQT